MTLSMYERQRWSEIERDLATDRRLASLARAHSARETGSKPLHRQFLAWLLVALLGAAGTALLVTGLLSGHAAGAISGVTLFGLLVSPLVVMTVSGLRARKTSVRPPEGP